jgi:hypothetical protein
MYREYGKYIGIAYDTFDSACVYGFDTMLLYVYNMFLALQGAG